MQRVEIITAKEPRRRWSDEEKRRLVAEAFAPGAIASHVARQHRVAESCLFAWRKRFSAPPNDSSPDQPPRLIPVVVDGMSAPVTSPMFEPTRMPTALRPHAAKRLIVLNASRRRPHYHLDTQPKDQDDSLAIETMDPRR